MAIYHYQSGSLLDSMQILTNESGGQRAYLHAVDSASSEKLRAAKQAIRARRWKCIPIVHDGKPALEVRGFKNADELAAQLKVLGLADSPTSITPDIGDVRSQKDKWANSTLKLAGASYLIGDSSYLYYRGAPLIKEWKSLSKGWLGGKFFGGLDVVAGIGYMLGSLSLARYGSRDQSINTISAATKKVERFSRKEGAEVAPETTLAFENQEPKRSFFSKIDHFISKYPSETLNSIYVGVGLFISAAAFYHGTRPIPSNLTGDLLKTAQKGKRNELIDVGLGIVTAGSALTGLLVKETKPVEGDKKRHGFGGVIDWIREKPLRATGFGYMIATAWHGFSTYNHWKDKTQPSKYLIGRAIFIATNVFSEVMLAISSKGHGTGVKPDESIDKSVIAATAELIFRQPSEKHEALIHQYAGYMASPEVLGGKSDVIAAELRSHLDLLDDNPWTKHYVVPKPAASAIVNPVKEQPLPEKAPGTRISDSRHVAMMANEAPALQAHGA